MIKAVLFDVDGVLLDSFTANLIFFQNLLSQGGYSAPTTDEYKPLFHRHMRDVIKILTEAPENEIDRIWEMGRSGTVAYPAHLLKLTDGADESIKKLHGLYQLGIVTSRIKEGIFTSAELANLKEYFHVAVGFQDTTKHKPDPEPIIFACEVLHVASKETVYIGDAETDFLAGKAAGTKVIMYSEKPFKNADATISSLHDLPKIIATI